MIFAKKIILRDIAIKQKNPIKVYLIGHDFYSIDNKVNKYYCKLCNYETIDSGNFSRHKKQIKHLEEEIASLELIIELYEKN